MDTIMVERKSHHGQNVRHLRELLDIESEILADKLGLEIGVLEGYESKEILEDDVLQKIAEQLKVTVDTIKNFDNDAATNIISNTFTSNDNSTLNTINHYCTFNPIDKIVELYERIIKEKDEKNVLLERILENGK